MPLTPTPRLETSAPRKLAGLRLTMSLAANRTGELWQSFMRRRHELPNRVGEARYSLQTYGPAYFRDFDFHAEFDKWALVEVADFAALPPGLEALLLPAGLYAVFGYRGAASGGAAAFRYIFETWLPGSGYQLDDRPHFELLGEHYRPDSPDSEEEIWIPIRPKLGALELPDIGR